MNCAVCIVNGLVPDPATVILNGQSVCSKHIDHVIAAPGSQGVTVSRMPQDSVHACLSCGHHKRVHAQGDGCAAGVGGGELCNCPGYKQKVIT
jgi:hypothetical protein